MRRLRDQQIQELRSELATKDLRLSAARAELLESHMQLQVLETLPFTPDWHLPFYPPLDQYMSTFKSDAVATIGDLRPSASHMMAPYAADIHRRSHCII